LFANCGLSGADFSSSDLSGAELARSILFNAILEDAKMTDTDLRAVSSPGSICALRVDGGHTLFPG